MGLNIAIASQLHKVFYAAHKTPLCAMLLQCMLFYARNAGRCRRSVCGRIRHTDTNMGYNEQLPATARERLNFLCWYDNDRNVIIVVNIIRNFDKFF